VSLRNSFAPSRASRLVLPAVDTLIAHRYKFLRGLGGGGMAVVYEVFDAVSGRAVALKRLHPLANEGQRRRVRELFEREYQQLSELSHPRIVEVFDYGLDEHGPYYTMELLDGGDLEQLVPASYSRVCAIARDVCSALSLLHSRRLLHRDVSPRNVRCAADGTTKLIDFGVMTVMGPNKEIVGTPAFTAPELLHLQPLDARTDLYALGATLYYVLTGRHAYPAAEFNSLPGLWSFAVARPSELVSEIPQALDSLILDLLQLDPRNRPSSASDVMERLAAIEGKPVAEQLGIAQAYLSAPMFVGRGRLLESMRSKARHAQQKRGSAILITAQPGLGRSRTLDASVLVGKLLGLTVLRTDADESETGDYGAMRSLLLQLQKCLPEATHTASTPYLPVLGHMAPELAGDRELALKAYEDASALRPELQHALRRLLAGVAAEHPLLIALDDLHRIDEPSVAAMALLARQLHDLPILLLATSLSDPSLEINAAHRVYAEAARHMVLQPLSPNEARDLLGSVFGEVAHLDLLVHRLLAVSHGNPRDLLRLAQHLVDRGAAHYRAGIWSLPARIDTSDLPNSVSDVLRTRVRRLSAGAHALGCALALCPDHSFGFDECRELSDMQDVAHCLQELIQADIVRSAGDRSALSDRAWVPVLLAELAPLPCAAIHLRLSKVFQLRGHMDFLAAQHVLRAGERERALDMFVSHAIESQELTDRSPEEFHKLIRSLPQDWLQTYEEALVLCQLLSRPKRELYALRSRLAGLVGVVGLRHTAHVATLIDDLRVASGLADWAALEPALAPMVRLTQALEATQARYDAASAHERTIDPLTGIRALARTTITAVGMHAPLLDAAAVAALPSLEPLAVLSPALSVVAQLVQGVHARLTGRSDRARERYKALLERTAAPDRAGLEGSHHRYMCVIVMNGLGMLEASMGLISSMDWAAQIESDPLFQVNALLVRVLYRLWQGDCLQAERDQRDIDTLRIASSARQNFENTHLLWQVSAHAAMDDLTRLKRTTEEIRRAGEELPGWQPVLAYSRAECQRVRGDLGGALSELTATLETCCAGEHQIWPNLAGAHIRTLDELGRSAEAVAIGTRYLELAHAVELGFGVSLVALPLAVAEARQARPDAALHADRVIEYFKNLGTTGLNLVLAYEARAKVAIAQDDRVSCARYMTLLEQACAQGGEEVTSAKLHKLRREAERRQLADLLPSLAHAPATVHTQLKSQLQSCDGPLERAQLELSLLAQHSGAKEGFLYRVTEAGPHWIAALGLRATPPEALELMVRDYVDGETQGQGDTTDESAELETATQWTAFDELMYRPVLLSHYLDDGRYVITGLCVFVIQSGQEFRYPGDLATQMSRLDLDMGDPAAMMGSAK
jgi:hypothetical protein